MDSRDDRTAVTLSNAEFETYVRQATDRAVAELYIRYHPSSGHKSRDGDYIIRTLRHELASRGLTPPW